MGERYGNVEVRPIPGDNSLDEIVIYGPNGECLFHLEKMSDQTYWMRAYGSEKDLVAHIHVGTGSDPTAPVAPALTGEWEWEEKA